VKGNVLSKIMVKEDRMIMARGRQWNGEMCSAQRRTGRTPEVELLGLVRKRNEKSAACVLRKKKRGGSGYLYDLTALKE